MISPLGPLVDTHAHLNDPRLKGRLAEVLQAAADAGVVQVIAVATTLLDSHSVVGLARDHLGIFAAVGIHPNDAVEAGPDDWDRICQLARDSKVVAIGESGLDRHWDRTPFALQQDYFDRHLGLADQLGRPIIIHSRDCHREIIDQLTRQSRPIHGVLHSFTGNWEEAQELLALGLHISFAGMLTFANKTLDPLRDAARQIPIDRLLVETDSPYLSPHPHRGKDNEPARVTHTVAKLAAIRGITVQELAQVTSRNAQQLFSLPDELTIDRS